MTKTLSVSPNPALPGTLVAVVGSGFPNLRIQLLLDGVGSTTDVFRPRPDGTFAVGRVVSSKPGTQTLVARQPSGGSWIEGARTSVVVKAVAPPPPAPTNVTATSGNASVVVSWT